MKALFLGLVFSAFSSSAFATGLDCICTAPNFEEKMNCGYFEIGSVCAFQFSEVGGVMKWEQVFVRAENTIEFSWSTDKKNVQQASLTPGVAFDFQYYGDNQVYTMTCNLKN